MASHLHLRKLTATDGPELDQAIHALRNAFTAQAIDFAFNGYDNTLIDPSWRSILLAALAPDSGEVWIAGVEEGDIDAVCIAYGPDRWYLKRESERKLRDEMFNNKLSEKGKKWYEEDFIPNLNKVHQLVLGDNSEQRNHAAWQIPILGTHPSKQGKGLGSALIRKIQENADIDGVETILEATTIENVLFYERLGFRNGGEPVIVPFEGGESGLWCLTQSCKEHAEP